MTEIELNENIAALLTERPVERKPSEGSRRYRRTMKVHKDERLVQIVSRHYIPHAGYADWRFDGTTLLHSGAYIKYPKNSSCQRWMKRLTSKKSRRYTELADKGNQYRRLFDYWWTLY